MKNLNRLVRMSFALGFISLLAMALSDLALSDIFHQIEADLSMEWKVLRISFLFILMFITVSGITIFKLKNKIQ